MFPSTPGRSVPREPGALDSEFVKRLRDAPRAAQISRAPPAVLSPDFGNGSATGVVSLRACPRRKLDSIYRERKKPQGAYDRPCRKRFQLRTADSAARSLRPAAQPA